METPPPTAVTEGRPVAPEAPASLPPEFAELYQKHAQWIHYFALRLLGDETQAQDATQDVFLKAWRNIGSFRGDADIKTWLYRITFNHCTNLRSSWNARNVHARSDDAVFELAPSPAGNPLRVLETKELGERIQGTLDRLPEEYRVLLLLVADQELSYEQVGELTGQTVDAVRGKLYRARKAFADQFQRLS